MQPARSDSIPKPGPERSRGNGESARSIAAGKIPIVLLVRGGAALPHIRPAQSTAFMDWSRIELRVFARETDTSSCLFALPGDARLHTLHLMRTAGGFRLDGDPLEGKVTWEVTAF